MLGTGNATVSHIYNTCFVLATSTTQLLVDAGGGNGILAQLRKANISIDSIHHLFVTHAHTDHILGVIWIVRMVAQCKGYQGRLHVYGNDKVMSVVRTIIDMVLAKKQLDKVDERVVFYQLTDGEEFDVGDMRLTCFDIHSNKEKQFGFRALLLHSVSLACLGDEPYNPINRPYVEHVDWMMCEAFCLYAQRDTFKPYEKCHSTALDAGKLAAQLDIKNLILYHTEEKTIDTRKQTYTQEAAQFFKGRIVVPDDLEEIEINVGGTVSEPYHASSY